MIYFVAQLDKDSIHVQLDVQMVNYSVGMVQLRVCYILSSMQMIDFVAQSDECSIYGFKSGHKRDMCPLVLKCDFNYVVNLQENVTFCIDFKRMFVCV